MGRQALLFCRDEKTVRAVTQVLAELDFEVVPATEPFAAIKKIMTEPFDALVVDCENEQNASLLFKNSRTAPNHQSVLAVAIVEGPAGVATAFRVGANLVLTKPIHLEQAKSTLRVARGLQRKLEAAKPATGKAEGAPTQTSERVPPISLSPQDSVSSLPHAASMAPRRSPSPAANPFAPINAGFPVANSAGAAAAPSRAISGAAAKPRPSSVLSQLETPREQGTEDAFAANSELAAAQAFAFDKTQPSSRGSARILLAIAAVIALAAAADYAWTRFPGERKVPFSKPLPVSSSPQVESPLANPAALPPQSAETSAAPQLAEPDFATANSESATGPATADVSPRRGHPAPPARRNIKPIVIKTKAKGHPADAAPSLFASAAPNGSVLPTAWKTPVNTAPSRLPTLQLSEDITNALLLKQTQPKYPRDAQRQHIAGPVQLLATISRNGEVSAVKILSGDSRLTHAAVDAVKKWKYTPYSLNGQAMEVQTQITVNFKAR
jgi:TonB family protein